MKTKKQCLELAFAHDLTIDLSQGRNLLVMVNLPEGYQFGEVDDQTGYSLWFDTAVTKKPEIWQEVYKDIESLVSMKPWHKVQIEVNA